MAVFVVPRSRNVDLHSFSPPSFFIPLCHCSFHITFLCFVALQHHIPPWLFCYGCAFATTTTIWKREKKATPQHAYRCMHARKRSEMTDDPIFSSPCPPRIQSTCVNDPQLFRCNDFTRFELMIGLTDATLLLLQCSSILDPLISLFQDTINTKVKCHMAGDTILALHISRQQHTWTLFLSTVVILASTSIRQNLPRNPIIQHEALFCYSNVTLMEEGEAMQGKEAAWNASEGFTRFLSFSSLSHFFRQGAIPPLDKEWTRVRNPIHSQRCIANWHWATSQQLCCLHFQLFPREMMLSFSLIKVKDAVYWYWSTRPFVLWIWIGKQQQLVLNPSYEARIHYRLSSDKHAIFKGKDGSSCDDYSDWCWQLDFHLMWCTLCSSHDPASSWYHSTLDMYDNAHATLSIQQSVIYSNFDLYECD